MNLPGHTVTHAHTPHRLSVLEGFPVQSFHFPRVQGDRSGGGRAGRKCSLPYMVSILTDGCQNKHDGLFEDRKQEQLSLQAWFPHLTDTGVIEAIPLAFRETPHIRTVVTKVSRSRVCHNCKQIIQPTVLGGKKPHRDTFSGSATYTEPILFAY